MLKRSAPRIEASLFGVDLALTALAFVLAYALLLRGWLPGAPAGLAEPGTYYWILLFIVPAWAVIFQSWGGYRRSRRIEAPLQEMGQVARAVFLGGMALAAFLTFTKSGHVSRSFVVWFVILDGLLLCGFRIAVRTVARSVRLGGRNFRTVVIVGTGPSARALADRLGANRSWGFQVLGHVDVGDAADGAVSVLGRLEDVPRLLCETVVDEVMVSVPPDRLAVVRDVFRHCEEVGVSARLAVDFLPVSLARVDLDEMDGAPMLTFKTTPREDWSLAVKRMMDILGSAGFLLGFGWLYLLIALVVRATSKGPVFYRQVRLGLYGRRFTMVKFRSMHEDADRRQEEVAHLNEMDGPIFKSALDPRVTGVGRVLRKFSLDEIPQMWNVLRGDMSLVGPRPPLPSEILKDDVWARRRLSIRPGITGLWQIEGRGHARYHRRMEMDLHYIDHWTLGLDVKILLKTVPAVLSGKGAC